MERPAVCDTDVLNDARDRGAVRPESAREAALQVVYVNYRSQVDLRRSVASLLADAPAVELTVVDNTCDEAESDAIAAWLPESATLVRSASNVGYGRGCNAGAAVGRAPYVLFLNPDTIVRPGMIARLLEVLDEHDGRALVGPRHYADEACEYAHAPLRGARLFDAAWDQVFGRGWAPGRPQRYLDARARLHGATTPVRVRCISGGCLAVGRATFAALGGWNEAYWMYGEDVELSIRARRRGVPVLLVPDARLVHFMEGSSRHLPEQVLSAQGAGRERFKHERYGRALMALDRGLTDVLRRLPQRGDMWRALTEWQPAELAAPAGSDRWAIELARSPLFDNCLTAFPVERRARVPLEMLDNLQPATYFLRVAGDFAGRWRQTCLHTLTKEVMA